MTRKTLALLPARGGSERILRKNIRNFCGKPMLSWPIETLKKCPFIDHLWVSTDDPEIAQIARGYGAQTPFLRPKHLADSFTGTLEVIQHANQWFEQNYQQEMGALDYILCVYPTAVFIEPQDLEAAYQLIQTPETKSVFSACSFPHPSQRALRIDENNFSQMLHHEYHNMRTQDLTPTYHDAGQFYLSKVQQLGTLKNLLTDQAKALVIPAQRAIDMDTEEDLRHAEELFYLRQQSL